MNSASPQDSVDSRLGAEVHRYRFGPTRWCILFEHGFHGCGEAGEVAARWDEVVSVKRSGLILQTLVVDRAHAEIALRVASGALFLLRGSDQGLIGLMKMLSEAALPHVIDRAMGELQRGGTLALSPDLRVSAQGIEVRERGRWETLPYQGVAGYRVRKGHCLIDENPARPRLKWKPFLGAIENGDVLVAALATFAPGKDLEEHPYRVPTGGTTAATYDPASVGTGTRLKIVALVAIPFVVIVGALMALAYWSQNRRFTEPSTVAETPKPTRAALVVEAAQKLESDPPPPATLTDACKAKAIHTGSMNVAFSGAAGPFIHVGPVLWDPPRSSVTDLFWEGSAQPVLVRVLDTHGLAKGGRARLFVRVLDSTIQPLCEGTVEGEWSIGPEAAQGSPEAEKTSTTTGIVELVLSDLCTIDDSIMCMGPKEGVRGVTVVKPKKAGKPR